MRIIQFGVRRPRVNNTMVCALLTISVMAPSHAKHEPEESVPESTKASPSVPRLSIPEYRSPLSAYKRYEEGDSPGWKELNDRVGEIGGWRVYAREAFESEDESSEMEDIEKDSK